MDKKSKKGIFANIIFNSLWLFGFCLVIMFFSLMFFVGDMNEILRFILGVVFCLPLFVLFYGRGNIIATKEFALRNVAISPDKTTEINKVPFWSGLVMVLPFIAINLIFVLLGNITGIYPLQNVSLYICLPATMCFKALGIITTLNSANWYAVLAVGVFLLLTCGMYFLGFFKTLADKERSFKEMLNEVKFNTKF